MRFRDHFGTGGLIGVACTACCVAPLVASLGLLGGLAVAVGIVAGIAAAVAAVLGGISINAARRRLSATCVPADVPILVDPPRRRT